MPRKRTETIAEVAEIAAIETIAEGGADAVNDGVSTNGEYGKHGEHGEHGTNGKHDTNGASDFEADDNLTDVDDFDQFMSPSASMSPVTASLLSASIAPSALESSSAASSPSTSAASLPSTSAASELPALTPSAPSSLSKPTQASKRTEHQPTASVLTLEVGAEVESQQDKENAIWHEIKNSHVTGTHLTGILGKVEKTDSGAVISVVDYKGQRIAIPLSEMNIALNRPSGQSDSEYDERTLKVLNRMMGAEIDFIVKGITGNGEERAAVASRKAAMLRLCRRYYLTAADNGTPQIYPGRIVEARIIAVSALAIRIEVFGVETSIRNQELTWGFVGDCRDEYFVGDSIQVRVKNIIGNTAENLRIKADIRSLTENTAREKLLALKPQTNCMGRVADISGGVIFINLIDGVKAIAHKCFDRRKPGRGDDVLFVCTRTNEEGGVAVGVVSRIVRRNI